MTSSWPRSCRCERSRPRPSPSSDVTPPLRARCVALDDVTLDHPAGRVRDDAGAVGLWQDDAAAHHRRLRAADRRSRAARRCRHHAGARPTAARSTWSSSGRRCFRTSTSPTTSPSACGWPASSAPSGTRESPRRCGSCDSRATASGEPTSSRVARCSGSRSRAHSSTGLACCCSTSRSRRSISRSGSRWRWSCGASTANRERRSCTSRMTSARRLRCPTASSSSTRAASTRSERRTRSTTSPLRRSRPASWATRTCCPYASHASRTGRRR